jgi:hypothetical protein
VNGTEMQPCADVSSFQFFHEFVPAHAGLIRVQTDNEKAPAVLHGVGRV